MKKLAIFASGSGTNAENIAKLFHQGNQVRVAVVLCNRKNAGVFARMEPLGVPVHYIPSSVWDSEPEKVLEVLKPYDIDLVVLAGFMRTVRPEIIDAFPSRMINIHPSLLPAYGGKGMYGHHVHEAVIAAGEKQSGVSVHYVTNEIDGGEIVMQQAVEITPQDTPETLEAKIHPVEYSLYPRAIVAALSKIDSADGQADALPEREVPHTGTTQKKNPKTVDEAWADVLKLKYDPQQAVERKVEAERQSRPTVPPHVPHSTPACGVSPANATTPQTPPQVPRTDTPKSYMAWAIVVTIVCCTIPGIIAIVYSASVSARMAASDIEGAHKASRKAQGWIIASFVLGLLSATLWLPVTIISSMF